MLVFRLGTSLICYPAMSSLTVCDCLRIAELVMCQWFVLQLYRGVLCEWSTLPMPLIGHGLVLV